MGLQALTRLCGKVLAGAVVVASIGGLAACDVPPNDQRQQWVARDAWDSSCAEKAMVEKWVAQNGHWKIKGSVWVTDVDAQFRLTDDCQSGLPLVGKHYKTLEVATYKGTVEMSKCKDKSGAEGWSLPGKEGTRCWVGPTLLEGPKSGVDVHIHADQNGVDVNAEKK